MLTEQQVVDQRERQIKSDDRNDGTNVGALLAVSQNTVADALNYFRSRYATDGVLTVSDMRTNVDGTDYAKWQAFIQQHSAELMQDPEGQYRLKSAAQQAGLDREHLLGAMVGISVAHATLGINQYNHQTIDAEAGRTLKFQNKVMRLRGRQPLDLGDQIETTTQKFIEEPKQGLTMDKRAWLRTDKLTSQVNGAVNRSLQVGLDDDYYQNHLFKDSSSSQNSVTKQYASAGGYVSNSLLRDAKTGIVALAGGIIAEQNQLGMGYWHDVEDERECENCINLANGGPYPANNVPAPPHPGCRCFVVYF